jgi:putative ABC transport system permease protein
LLRPLPFAEPDRLVMIFNSFQQQGMEHGPAGIADFLDWKARARSFQTLDAIANQSLTLVGDGEAEQISGRSVTATFFETLGIRPLLGRTFAPDDDKPGRAQTVTISERRWRRRYGSSHSIMGKQITMNGQPFTIIGVMPDSFRLGGDAEAWSILTLNPPTRRGPFFMQGIARLKPGITIEAAAAEMQAIAQQVERENPKDYTRLGFPVVALRERIVGNVRPLLWVLSGAVFFVFLIAVSNVANLMLARATARQREIAIRLSIGAGRGQLVRQLMTESLMLSLAGGALGQALGYWGVMALRWLEPPGLPRLSEIGVDRVVLAFTLVVSLVSALLFGLGPALSASSAALSDRLKEGGRGGESRAHRRTRGALVVAQLALSVSLLIGAGLLIRSFHQLGTVQPGFHAPPDRVLTMLLSPTGSRYRAPAPVTGQRQPNRALGAYWDQLLDRVRTLPGVEAASVAISIPPADRVAFTDGYEIGSKPAPPGSDHPAVPVPYVSHDYFKTPGIPLLRGRWFDSRDHVDSPRVTVICEVMARRHFQGENPVGKRLKHGSRSLTNPYMEIVGVVGDVKYEGLHNEAGPVYYELSTQVPARPMWLLVRTRGEPYDLAAAVRREIHNLDPSVPAQRVGTMAQALAESVAVPRFRSLLLGGFAATALLLAAIGIYGVMAYSVAQRTKEIGVRVALGSTSLGVVRLVLGQGGRLVVVGIALGLAGAAGLTRFLGRMLFGIEPFDAVTFAGAALVIGAVAIVACTVPAFRAARVDPVSALRQE